MRIKWKEKSWIGAYTCMYGIESFKVKDLTTPQRWWRCRVEGMKTCDSFFVWFEPVSRLKENELEPTLTAFNKNPSLLVAQQQVWCAWKTKKSDTFYNTEVWIFLQHKLLCCQLYKFIVGIVFQSWCPINCWIYVNYGMCFFGFLFSMSITKLYMKRSD